MYVKFGSLLFEISDLTFNNNNIIQVTIRNVVFTVSKHKIIPLANNM